MDYDQFLSKTVGDFNPYVQRVYFLLCVAFFLASCNSIGQVFFAAIPDHWCKIPETLANFSEETRKELFIPVDTNDGQFSRCKNYDLTNVSFLLKPFSEMHQDVNWTDLGVNVSTLRQILCSSWGYDHAVYDKTIVTEWDLVCDRAYLAATPAAVMSISALFSSLLGGFLADRYGRRAVLLWTTGLTGLVGCAAALSFEPISYTIVLAAESVLGGTLFNTAFVLQLELVGSSWRVFAGVTGMIFWALGYVTMAGVAYFIRNWRHLTLAVNVPLVLLVSLYIWYVPESPRWLLSVDRKPEAVKIMRKMIKNEETRTQFDKHLVALDKDTEEISSTFKDLFKSGLIIWLIAANGIIWCIVSLVYYGLSFNTNNLSGDNFVNYAISGAVEIPANIVTMLCLKYGGRRWPTIGSFFLCAVSIFTPIVVPADLEIIKTVMSMVGKFAAAAAYSMVYVYTAEQFPTSVRNLALGWTTTTSCLGSFISPYLALMGNVDDHTLPLLIFSTTSLIACVIAFFLPETYSIDLPDTVHDTVALSDQMMPCVRACCRKSPRLRYKKDVQPASETSQI